MMCLDTIPYSVGISSVSYGVESYREAVQVESPKWVEMHSDVSAEWSMRTGLLMATHLQRRAATMPHHLQTFWRRNQAI